jgi:hypothetical protein
MKWLDFESVASAQLNSTRSSNDVPVALSQATVIALSQTNLKRHVFGETCIYLEALEMVLHSLPQFNRDA